MVRLLCVLAGGLSVENAVFRLSHAERNPYHPLTYQNRDDALYIKLATTSSKCTNPNFRISLTWRFKNSPKVRAPVNE